MHNIGKVTVTETSIRLQGWCFKEDSKLTQIRIFVDGIPKIVEGFGIRSDDVAAFYGEAAREARFDITQEIQYRPSHSMLEFTFSDGTKSNAPIKLSNERPSIVPIEHRIINGTYTGRFVIPNDLGISSVRFLDNNDDLQYSSNPVPFRTIDQEGQRVIYIKTPAESSWNPSSLGLAFYCEDGITRISSNIPIESRQLDYSHQIVGNFFKWLQDSDEPLNVLEIGSRARSGVTRKHQFGEKNHYTGLDIKTGSNVDIVCDIHRLSSVVDSNSIDAIGGFSVFEHIAMPWKAVIELNKVLKQGGRCMFHTHQTWPLHETPFDFWRFSEDSWRTIFNRATGFRILESASRTPATIHPLIQHPDSNELERALGYLSSSVLVEKTNDTDLSWDVDLDEIHQGEYPA